MCIFTPLARVYMAVHDDTHTLDNCLKPESRLAWEMNYEDLPEIYSAPLRLRLETSWDIRWSSGSNVVSMLKVIRANKKDSVVKTKMMNTLT